MSKQYAESRGAQTELLDRLGAVLLRQTENLKRLEGVLEEEHAALRTASIEGLAEAAAQKRDLMEIGRRLDLERRKVVSAIARSGIPEDASTDADAALQLTVIIDAAEDQTRRAALMQVRSELRACAERVQEKGTLLATAATSLVRHVSGLLQSVQSALSQPPVYGRQGRMDSSGGHHAVDVRS